MSQHDMSVRGTLQLKPGVGLPQVLEALHGLTTDFDVTLEEGAVVPEFGMAPFANMDDNMELQESGRLTFNFTGWGPGHGTVSDAIEDAVQALDPLVAAPGAVEYIDHDTSAANDDAIAVRFVGATEEDKRLARIEYGLGKAREWLEPCMGRQRLCEIEAMARSASAA